jgi:small-conductance mechanosensitive channel
MNQLLTQWRAFLDFPLVRAGGVQFTVGHLIELAVLLSLVWLAEMLFRRVFLTRVLIRSRLRPSVQFAITKIARYLFLVLGVYLSLQAVEINLSSLAFLAGALGVGVGFGLQNIVSNFISGLIILAEQPIALGDRVEISGAVGRVAEINLRSTTVITSDNICMIIPNSNLITGTVVNWSHGDPTVRTRLPVGVAYGTDIEKVRTVLLQVAADEPDVLKSPEPEVFFVGYGDSAINLELAVWSSIMLDKPMRFRSRLYYAIHKTLESNKIEIPFPQRDLHLRSGTLLLQNGSAATAVSPKRDSDVSKGD